MTICKNAGGEGAVVIHKLLADADPLQGYDASCDKFTNMFEAGPHPFLCSSARNYAQQARADLRALAPDARTYTAT